MKVSVITATFNSVATVRETLQSVVSQDHKDIEYIIVDGGSEDGTLDVITEFSGRIAKVITGRDNGIYDALNKGISAATGDVIAILHSDDFYTSNDVISRYVQAFSNTGADAVYSDLFYVDRDNTARIIRRWKSGEPGADGFYQGWMPPHPTFMVRKVIYDRFGLFDNSFRISADYELMLRFILRHRIRLTYLPFYSVKMRVGGISNAGYKNRIAANREDRRAWKVNGLTPRFYTLTLKPLRKIGQFF